MTYNLDPYHDTRPAGSSRGSEGKERSGRSSGSSVSLEATGGTGGGTSSSQGEPHDLALEGQGDLTGLQVPQQVLELNNLNLRYTFLPHCILIVCSTHAKR